MIFTDRTITVQKGVSSLDETVVLYRGDKEVEIRFTLNEKVPFKFGSGTDSNIIEKTEAAYGQLVIRTPNGLPSIFSEVTPTNRGKIVFKIAGAMIDEITEVGNYTFQIRLLDENKESRVTIPEVVNGIEIREPIATEDVSTTNEVGVATVGYALTTTSDNEDAFDSQGNYNKTTWQTGDRITAAKLDKIEAGIDGVNKKVASGGTTTDNTNNAILLVTQAQYDSLVAGETVSINGVEHTYDANRIYGITDATESSTFNGILTSPNGTEYILTVDNNGNLSTTLKPVLCTGVSLDTNSLTFETNATQTLHATFTPSNTTENKVWSSDSPSIARVANGVVTPVSNGSCTITITCGSFSATCSVTVNVPGESGGTGGGESPTDPQDFVNYAYNTDTYTNPTTTNLVNKNSYYTISNMNKSVNEGVLTLTIKEGSSKSFCLFKLGIGDNNTYYNRALIRTSSQGVKAGLNGGTNPVPADNEWHLVSYVAVDKSPHSKGFGIDLDTSVVNGPIELKELMKINLTEVYGAGNEPDKATCDATFTTYKTGLIG